jgi:hypothetical protein
METPPGKKQQIHTSKNARQAQQYPLQAILDDTPKPKNPFQAQHHKADDKLKKKKSKNPARYL